MAKLREYHFSAGNSSKGPIGFCATVRAHSKAEAVELLSSALPETYETGISENNGAVLYLNVYFNSQAVKASQIDEVTDAEKS
jgi:hypothetical protein